MLCLAGKADELVPPANSQAMVSAAALQQLRALSRLQLCLVRPSCQSSARCADHSPSAPLCTQAQHLPDARLLLLDGAYTSWLQQSQVFLPALAAFLG